MRRHRVEELGANLRLERGGSFLDQPQPQMNVAEEPAFLGLPEVRRRAELAGPAEVVQNRCGEEQIRPQARMQLRRLAADRGDADRVLEEAAGVAVVTVGCRR